VADKPRAGTRSAPRRRVVRLGGEEVAFLLRRRRRMRNLVMRVDHDGLMVTAPYGASLAWIDSVLAEKAGWILKKLKQQERNPPMALQWCEGALFPYLGEPHRLELNPQGALWPVQAFDGRLVLSLPGAFDPAVAELHIGAWYRAEALSCFRRRVAELALPMGVRVASVGLSDSRTQWGSCSADGRVLLNWRLIQLPLRLIDYVVVHELAHLKELNHSPAFWAHVARVYPDYREARRELRRHG
jgi:predicted metal-dependent hydrolase